MADREVQNLDELTAPAAADVLYIVDDPAGTPLARKVQVSTLIGYLVTTAGDILYATAARTLARLGIGTAGQVLAVNAGATAPAWANAQAADGWTPDTATWTYASATTFTVATDVTAQFRKGTKLKTTNSGTKYNYVASSSYGAPNTTVTVLGDGVANAAITSPYYSYAATPQAFPDWFSWTPTFTGFSSAPSAPLCRFNIQGTLCTICVYMPNNGTSNAITFYVSLPVTAATVTGMYWRSLLGYAFDNGASVAPGYGQIASAGTTIDLYRQLGADWTNSGNKRADFSAIYQI